MVKKGKSLSLKIVSLIMFFLVFNVILYFFQNKNSKLNLTGFSIKSDIIGIYSSMSIYSKIFFIGQWIVLVFILLIMVIKNKKIKKNEDKTFNIHIRENSDKKKTDLDILYDILKEEKELKISTISKSFNIKKEIATEWCEILEYASLATIEYPGFSEPVLRIVEKNTLSNTEQKKEPKKEMPLDKEKKKIGKQLKLKKIKNKK
jgi:hypothetical protein